MAIFKRKNNKTKVLPEVVAAVLFKVMENKGGLKSLMDQFPAENAESREAEELELKFLTFFCNMYALAKCLGDTPQKDAVQMQFCLFLG